MNRIILVGRNSEFPRAAHLLAATHSGAQPESAAGGTRQPLAMPLMPPEDAGLPRARRPRGASLLAAMAAIAKWDSGEFDTLDIAHSLGLPEAEVVKVLHVIREERRTHA